MPERHYNPAEIESKWQKHWEKKGLFKVKEVPGQKKYYLLEMLPYPSGRLHMGHVRNYTIGDVATRCRMMQGFKVLHPMGWDAFGMPAENAAIKEGVHPAKWTKSNIDYMRGQFKRLGCSYDWEREFATCDPDYYRWDQLIFVRMFEKGWAYKKSSQINWCPTCQTVLANEQAEGGVCWRCDSGVVGKPMSQWFFRITDYAEELLRDIDEKLTGWPERVRIMQREWIGKSVGALIRFPLLCKEGKGEVDHDLPHPNPPLTKGREFIEVFTTRPDTIFGVTFMSIACEHPLVKEFVKGTGQERAVAAFAEKSSHIDHEARLANTYEKDGVFTGAYCINPMTGARVPIYAANFVLMDYGTGAVMAVPAHDQRDFEFAKKYKLPVKVVIQPEGEKLDARAMAEAWEGPGTLVDSGEFTGMNSEAAIRAISEHFAKKKIGGPAVTYRLKDWCISRQRYWGAPIPIIYCDSCGTVPVPDKDLPVVLPHDVEFTGEGGSPIAKLESFVDTKCPRCKGKARRETDTMDTFVESSWYMLRYACPKYDKGPVDPKMIEYWLPVDQYIGGIEHAVGHLIYCRYFTKVMRDLGMLKLDEPVKNLMTQGMVYKDGAKMSKSKGNVVDPDDMIAKFGADTVRLFSLFAAPPEKDLEWSERGVEGAHRFLIRVWRIVSAWKEGGGGKGAKATEDIGQWRNRTIQRVTEDVDRYHFNTAIAAVMEYVNFLYGLKVQDIPAEAIETLILLVSPFAPHAAEELWELLGHSKSTLHEPWPAFDPAKAQGYTVTYIVQVGGKMRDKLDLPIDMPEEDVKAAALASAKVAAHLEGKAPQKVIFVPKRLVNIVV
ncbi:MAG: leucine--tRNA ligase [Pseudomonadota bacterium]